MKSNTQPRYRLAVRQEFSASHQLCGHGGKCEQLHGHNFGVTVEVTGTTPDPVTGMVVDFGILKAETRAVLETLDHQHLNQAPQLEGASPSSENLARYIFGALQQKLAAHSTPGPVNVLRVTVEEKPGQSATYEVQAV